MRRVRFSVFVDVVAASLLVFAVAAPAATATVEPGFATASVVQPAQSKVVPRPAMLARTTNGMGEGQAGVPRDPRLNNDLAAFSRAF